VSQYFHDEQSSQRRNDAMLPRKQRYVQVLLCLTPLLVLTLDQTWFPIGIRIVLLGVMLLGLIRWTAAILLILIQVHWYMDSFPRTGLNVTDLILILLTVLSLMILSRLRSAQELTGIRSVSDLLSASIEGVSSATPSTTGPSDSTVSAVAHQHQAGREVIWLLTRSLIILAIAGMLPQWIPAPPNSAAEYGLTASGIRTIQLGLLLFAAWLMLALPLAELRWKRMAAAPAGVWLRSQFVGWYHRDMRAVEKRRRRLHRKSQKAAQRAAKRGHGDDMQSSPNEKV